MGQGRASILGTCSKSMFYGESFRGSGGTDRRSMRARMHKAAHWQKLVAKGTSPKPGISSLFALGLLTSIVRGIHPPLPRSCGIIELGRKFRQVFGFKGLVGKVFRNKDLGVMVSPFIASPSVPRFTSAFTERASKLRA